MIDFRYEEYEASGERTNDDFGRILFSLQSSVCCEIRCSTAKRDELIAAVNEWQIEIKKCLALVLRSLCRSLDVDDNVCEESSSPFTNRSSG